MVHRKAPAEKPSACTHATKAQPSLPPHVMVWPRSCALYRAPGVAHAFVWVLLILGALEGSWTASNLINKHKRKIWTWAVHRYTLEQRSSSRLLVSECILIVFPLIIIPYSQVSLNHQTQPVTGRRPLSLYPCSILRFRGSPWGLIHHSFRFLGKNL